MGGKREQNGNVRQDSNATQDTREFNFINEKVLEKGKSGPLKFLSFLVACGVIIGLVACFTFLWAKPYFKRILKNADKNTTEANQLETFSSDQTSEKVSDIEEQEETTQTIEERIKNMENTVLTLAIKDDDWTNTETVNNKYSSGLIISVGDTVKILTTYSFVAENKEITVYIGKNRCAGFVDKVSKEYGLAVVNVNISKLDNETIEELKEASFAKNDKCEVGESITFMGNPYGKEKFIANGSLTSVGNTYNIVDTELEIITTDITNTGIMNGFAYNSYGKVVGMVNDSLNNSSIGNNLISLISINEVYDYIYDLVKGNQITYLGIIGKVVTDEVIENIDNDMPYGIYISGTEEKSPAYVAGIMNGDIITEINGKKILNFDDYTSVLRKCQIDSEVIVKVMRKGKDGYKEIKYTVKIGGR